MIKRILTLILTGIFAALPIASCGPKTVTPSDSVTVTETTKTDETSDRSKFDDLGDCIWWELIRDGIFNTMYTANERNLASALASKKDEVNAKLDLINDVFTKLD